VKIIKDGDCYNQVLKVYEDGKQVEYVSLSEPPEEEVLYILDFKNTKIQYVNYYLCKADKGFVLTYGDTINLLPNFRVAYLDFVEWVRDEYLNKRFSWQREDKI